MNLTQPIGLPGSLIEDSLWKQALTASIWAEMVSLQVLALRESGRRTGRFRHFGSPLKRIEQEGPPITQRAFSYAWAYPLRLPFAVVAAPKAEAEITERIEPAMLKGVFPTTLLPITIPATFFTHLPTALLPIIAISAIVLPIIAVSAIALPFR